MPTKTFRYSGAWERWNVPTGVEVITVTIHGAGSNGVPGGYVTGKMKVNPKRDLMVLVGQAGQAPVSKTGGVMTRGGGGAGGNGSGTGNAGWSGGGATFIRWDTRTGYVKVAVGGAGGTSGQGALGGKGGAAVGEIGAVYTGYPGTAESATGGTQVQSGKGGTSTLGSAFYGAAGEQAVLGRGGQGGTTTTVPNIHGGGGGGGGYYPGGGGAAGRAGVSSGGGGAGGATFVGGMVSPTSVQGGGFVGNGRVVITWLDPDDPNNPPKPPANIVINGEPIADGLPTKAKTQVILKGTPDDPDAQNNVRLYVRVSSNPTFTRYATFRGTWDETEQRDKVVIDGLVQDTLYYVRIYTQDQHRRISTNYRSTSFWTNRSPAPPALVSPVENANFTSLVNVTFEWNHTDADPSDPQSAFTLQYRTAATPIVTAGVWTSIEQATAFDQWTLPAGTFKGNTLYEWRVRTRDGQGRWGQFSDTNSFYVIGDTTAPILNYPVKNEAVVAAFDNDFRWTFRTPLPGTLQERADLRYRVVGTELWNTLFGTVSEPGGSWTWPIPADTFTVGYRYEWQLRTWAVGDTEPSEWTDSQTFWTIAAPESGPGLTLISSGEPQAPLGVGVNKVFIYDRGGKVLRGEIKPTALIRWGRKRDDISQATIVVTEFDEESRKFLGSLRTWQFEVVIFRNGKRVWEGPITRLTYPGGRVEIEAKDVMAYVYRRIMRQGYNDSYRLINGQQAGQSTVVERSSRIIMNALAYDDPNVLSYLTPMYAHDDARNSRVVYDYTRTAWEEVDDLAATAGLDYTVSGRRIILWDTHRPIGRLPEMRDGDFNEPPVVSEYGMSAANYFAVNSSSNVWGDATKVVDGDPGPTGWLEQLASAYGESEAVGTEQELTREDRERLSQTLSEQAGRNIEGRWPPPLVVRIPDNSTLNPQLNLDVNQLIPGVWVPLRATETVREVSQWQKLDSIDVEQAGSDEKISVVMSPAPQGGADPDADAAAEEE